MTTHTNDPMWSDFDERGSISNSERPYRAARKAILYIDQYRLSRDCIAYRLSSYLSEFQVKTIANAEDLWMQDTKTIQFVLSILHAHMARPGEDKIAVQLMQLAHFIPNAPVVLLSDIREDPPVAEALRLGVCSCITTGQPMREASELIRAAAIGSTVPPGGPNATRPSSVASSAQPQAASANLHVKFTRRQTEVLTLLSEGKPNKLIAHELSMSQSTVKVHIRLIMKKLHATNRTQVVALSRPVGDGGGTLSHLV
jgi:DNA-binding NarL/FixJ family response regulator